MTYKAVHMWLKSKSCYATYGSTLKRLDLIVIHSTVHRSAQNSKFWHVWSAFNPVDMNVWHYVRQLQILAHALSDEHSPVQHLKFDHFSQYVLVCDLVHWQNLLVIRVGLIANWTAFLLPKHHSSLFADSARAYQNMISPVSHASPALTLGNWALIFNLFTLIERTS